MGKIRLLGATGPRSGLHFLGLELLLPRKAGLLCGVDLDGVPGAVNHLINLLDVV